MANDVTLQTALLAIEEQRCRAMVAFDRPVLEALISDELQWIHASGRIDGKATLLETLERDKPYRRLSISDHSVRRFANLCISTGEIEVVLGASASAPYSNLFTNLWLTNGETWTLVHGQSTRCSTGRR